MWFIRENRTFDLHIYEGVDRGKGDREKGGRRKEKGGGRKEKGVGERRGRLGERRKSWRKEKK